MGYLRDPPEELMIESGFLISTSLCHFCVHAQSNIKSIPVLAPPVGRVVHVQEAVSPLVHLKATSDTVATYPADLHASAVPDPDSDTPAQTDKFLPQDLK